MASDQRPVSGTEPAELEPPTVPFRNSQAPSLSSSTPSTFNRDLTDTPAPGTPGVSDTGALLADEKAAAGAAGVDRERGVTGAAAEGGRRPWWKRWWVWVLAFGIAVVIILVVVLPVELVAKKGGSGSSSSSAANPESPTGATTGGNGSTIVMENGTTFTYINEYGGYWVYDQKDPFNLDARPNSWTPPLNTSWTWGQDRVFGVNLGGLFVLEPFIAPALFQKYPTAVDEWTLSELMRNDTSEGGGIGQLETHYDTFITEQDIAEIAGAGLNWIRIPIPYWAIEVWEGEPFLAQTSWNYILKVLKWARKYGLRVNLDLHTIPGSQNGYNHSGRLGEVNFMNGVMGIANAERALSYIRIITEFISQQEYVNLIPMFGIVNEALVQTIGQDQMTRFYLQAHDMIRGITGYGKGNGPYISIHDGFIGIGAWADFLPGSDRINLDTHPYFAFDGQPNDAPIATDTPNVGGTWPQQACNAWGPGINTSQTAFGVTVAGEFSAGYNDCGLFVKGVNSTTTYGGDCSLYEDASQWNQTLKDGLKAFVLASMDATQDWFFWTWKIGDSSAGHVQAPLWSYKAGLEGGWIPTDPRESVGACGALGVTGPQFNGTYESWQTGGSGAGTISATALSSFSQWPPPSLSGLLNTAAAASLLPQYTSTGSVVTLSMPTYATVASEGDGWYDTSDAAGKATQIAGCSYPDAWSAVSITMPTAVCTGGAAKRAAEPVVTPAPAPRR